MVDKNFRNIPTRPAEIKNYRYVPYQKREGRSSQMTGSLRSSPSRNRQRRRVVQARLCEFMFENRSTAIFHSNRYPAQSACEHCAGIIRHERWCVMVDQTVYYVYQIVTDHTKLTIGDSLILHALGVLWGPNRC